MIKKGHGEILGVKKKYYWGGGTENPQKGVFLRSLMGVKKKKNILLGGGVLKLPKKVSDYILTLPK